PADALLSVPPRPQPAPAPAPSLPPPLAPEPAIALPPERRATCGRGHAHELVGVGKLCLEGECGVDRDNKTPRRIKPLVLRPGVVRRPRI
ncbi:MAG: hypothetical protein KGK07_16005, partial [Chloroflexota bacterium]|nr:hypothetical protein [Chloroflexota bacterium]